jgi:hypothetical protein
MTRWNVQAVICSPRKPALAFHTEVTQRLCVTRGEASVQSLEKTRATDLLFATLPGMDGNTMDSNVLQDEWLNKAFQLAYFIHGDKTTAMQIVTSAMTLLEVAAAAQDKRLYYTPTGRTLARKARTKVSLSEIHLLQRLIYIESEPFEKTREKNDVLLDEKDLLAHFIKHLVKITVKRNSFYVALGLSRLLHNYTTVETQEIYNIVVQDPERVKDDYYYRSRKAQLMREMKERFADLLTCVKGQRGEEKFQSVNSCDSYREVVAECLQMFTPWGTPCLMPAQFDVFNDVLRHLSFKDADPDEEHQVEVNRIHTLLHSECYSRLTTSIGFDSPELKLQIPQFSFVNQNQGGPKSGRKNKMTLHKDELEGIRENLTSQATRRKHVAAGLFRILVDGKEHARFDVKEKNNIHFEINEGAELIEVRTSDERGELLLASHLLEFDSNSSGNKPFNRSIVLEAGQKVSFSVKPFHNPAGEMDGAIVDVTYKETSLMRAASLFLQQLKTRAAQGLGLQKWLPVGAIKPLLATLFLALCAAIVFFYFQSTKNVQQRANHNSPVVVPDQQNNKENVPQTPSDRAGNNDLKNQEPEKDLPQRNPNERENQDKIADTQRHNNRQKNPNTPITDGNRDFRPSIVGVPLVDVKNIAIAPYGTETLNPQLREAIAAALQSSGRFTVAQNSGGVDAVLKISTKQELTEQPDKSENATAIAMLVNAKGYVVWPVRTTGSGKLYNGNINEIAAKIAADILREIQKAER